MLNRKTCINCAIALLWSLTVVTAAHAANTDEYRFDTYGMTCNQCAYGVEQTLQHTDGVADAIVNLSADRDINVVVQTESGATAEVGVLVRKILDQSVSIARVEATITGRLEQTAGSWRLVAGQRSLPVAVDGESPDLTSYAGRKVRLDAVIAGLEGVDDATGELRLFPRKLTRV